MTSFTELFTEFDIKLLTILNKLWYDHFNQVVTESLNYTINLTSKIMTGESTEVEVIHEGKSTNTEIIIVGMYNKEKEIFSWHKNVNKLFYDMMYDDIKKTFETTETIEKMFEKDVPIKNKFYHAIPALVGMFFSKYNIIKFVTEDNKHVLYALINLKINNEIDYDNFFKSVHKKLSRSKNYKKGKN